MADRNGTAGAVAGLLAQAQDAMPSEGEQLDMLATTQRPASQRLHVTSPSGKKDFFHEGRLAQEVERSAKAGRPKGAQNLATRELKDWIVRLLGGTPQERMARWAMLEPEELARRLNCTVAAAFDRQQAILRELAPYFMARMQPVDDQGRTVPLVALSIGGQVGQANGAQPWSEWFANGQPQPDIVDVTPEEGE